jgi:hypothetical protein
MRQQETRTGRGRGGPVRQRQVKYQAWCEQGLGRGLSKGWLQRKLHQHACTQTGPASGRLLPGMIQLLAVFDLPPSALCPAGVCRHPDAACAQGVRVWPAEWEGAARELHRHGGYRSTQQGRTCTPVVGARGALRREVPPRATSLKVESMQGFDCSACSIIQKYEPCSCVLDTST